MEIALLILIAYILSVFLNRWLNYIVYKKYDQIEIITPVWFLSIIGTFILLIGIIVVYFDKPNWFTGRDWDKK